MAAENTEDCEGRGGPWRLRRAVEGVKERRGLRRTWRTRRPVEGRGGPRRPAEARGGRGGRKGRGRTREDANGLRNVLKVSGRTDV